VEILCTTEHALKGPTQFISCQHISVQVLSSNDTKARQMHGRKGRPWGIYCSFRETQSFSRDLRYSVHTHLLVAARSFSSLQDSPSPTERKFLYFLIRLHFLCTGQRQWNNNVMDY